jgi:hypothetical protein
MPSFELFKAFELVVEEDDMEADLRIKFEDAIVKF